MAMVLLNDGMASPWHAFRLPHLPLLVAGSLDADEEGVEGDGVVAQQVVEQAPKDLQVLHHLHDAEDDEAAEAGEGAQIRQGGRYTDKHAVRACGP